MRALWQSRAEVIFNQPYRQTRTAQTWEGTAYRLESYEDHIHRVLSAFERLVLPEIQISRAGIGTGRELAAG